ncbi:MAG: U32 family peptidase [Bacteroidales bacterium]|nr:U32 family peptidase [Bacteroidales bacterium]
MKTIELLSPAKDLEVGMAAINHGADAVYIGGPDFGAREKVSNSIEDIEKLCRHAALYDAKVYVTLNTLLRDNELERARKIVYDCWNVGVDAMIVQDMSLLMMDLPPIPLHASTQCNNLSLEKVQFLEKVGFSQVVLGRELSLEQIKEIRANTSVPLEFFVHGSLCVCQSGQCYLSHYLGNRSANRGACAQPCRLPWNLLDENGKTLIENRHLLSLKDLNNSAHLEQLIDAGITSFKIEGRLKEADYVKNVTAFYRKKLDEIISRRTDLQQASNGRCSFGFEVNPEKSFSRGFTDYFIEGRKEGIDSPFTPKSMGEYVGEVTWCNSVRMELRTDKVLHNGDGFCFIDENDELKGLRADVANGKTISSNRPHGATRGTKIYRNLDIEWQKQVDASNGNRKIDIQLSLEENEKGYEFIASVDGCRDAPWHVSTTTECEKIIANNPEKATENIRKKALQWGDTIFNPVDLKLDFAQPYLIPASVIGEMKRNLVEKLMNQLVENHKNNRSHCDIMQNDTAYPETELSYLGNVTNALAADFYRQHGVNEIEDGLEKSYSKQSGIKVMTTKHCIRYANGMCSKETGKKATPLILSNEKGTFRLEFDCRNCQMNIFAV